MIDIVAVLSKTELFSGLADESLRLITDYLEPVSFEPDFVVCREGDVGRVMYIIISGAVAVSSDMGWGQRELDRVGPGAVFGEMALISNDVRNATVRAIERTECLQLDSVGFDSLLDRDPALAQRIAKIMTRRFSGLVHKTSRELIEAYRALIFALANMTESRDPETGAHLERTRNYCVLLAEELAKNDAYKSAINHQFIDAIYQAAPLHDIGKVAISDSILFKPTGLVTDEYDRMKEHTRIGAAMMEKVIKRSGTDLFRMAARVCRSHHERWDGKGYPDGLAGDAIPLEARIMALADVYDALLSKRAYKKALSMQEAIDGIRSGAGTQFDPTIADAMLKNIGKFEEVYRRFRDEDDV